MQTIDNSPEMQRFAAAVEPAPEIPPVTLARLRAVLKDRGDFYGLHGIIFHYTGLNAPGTARHECRKIVGPRGGVGFRYIPFRVSGGLKTWKTRPTEFRLPVKFGLRDSYEITDRNAADWHFAADCPIKECRF